MPDTGLTELRLGANAGEYQPGNWCVDAHILHICFKTSYNSIGMQLANSVNFYNGTGTPRTGLKKVPANAGTLYTGSGK